VVVNVVLETPRLADVQACALTKHLIDCLPKAVRQRGRGSSASRVAPVRAGPRSVRYAWAGGLRATGRAAAAVSRFDQSAETVTARYKDKVVLTLIDNRPHRLQRARARTRSGAKTGRQFVGVSGASA